MTQIPKRPNFEAVDSIFNDVIQKGAKEVKKPTTEPWGQRQAGTKLNNAPPRNAVASKRLCAAWQLNMNRTRRKSTGTVKKVRTCQSDADNLLKKNERKDILVDKVIKIVSFLYDKRS